MTGDRPDRQLPSHYVRYFLQAAEDEIGGYSLTMILRQANLDRLVGALPHDDPPALPSSQLAALVRGIRHDYGRGAHGCLSRIGRSVWQRWLKFTPFWRRIGLRLARLASRASRCRRALEFLAARMREPGGQVSVHILDQDLSFMDQTSDATHGQLATAPVCWLTLGMIQGALAWAVGDEVDVEEIACRAMGAEACKFRIRF